METEYSSYRLGREKSQLVGGGIGQPRICRFFAGLGEAWSSAIQGRQGPMTIPTMLRVLFS